jgi:hypothetical protein
MGLFDSWKTQAPNRLKKIPKKNSKKNSSFHPKAFNNEHESVRLLALATAVSAVLGCIYLAYILYFVLKDFCLVCNASYIINALILYYNWTLFYLPSEP